MKFGSWTFDINQLHFVFYKGIKTLDLSDYLKSGTWDIIDCPAEIINFTDTSTNVTRSMYISRFKLRRKTLFYLVNLIIPCVLISLLSVCVFSLPTDAGEKITLCISILLALVVFLLLISKILPPALTIALISKFLLFTFIINIIAIGSTVFVINMNFRTPRTHVMQNWIRVVFLNYLPTILFMRRPDHLERSKVPEKTVQRKRKVGDIAQKDPTEMHAICRSLLEDHHQNCELHQSPVHNAMSASNQSNTPDPEYQRAMEAIRFIKSHIKKEDEYDTVIMFYLI